MTIYLFLGLVALIRLITALVLLRVGVKKNMPNLKWLAWGFLTTIIAIPFTVNPYYPFVDKAIAYVTYLCFAIFIHQTFYRGKRSPLIPFWTIFTVLFIILFWTTGSFLSEVTGVSFPQNIFMARPTIDPAVGSTGITNMEMIDSFIYGLLQLSIWLWHALAAFQAYRFIAKDRYVEDWIKSRYQTMVAYSTMQSLVGLGMMLRFTVSDSVTSLLALMVILTTFMQYLVWTMPDWYRKFTNRNYHAPVEEF